MSIPRKHKIVLVLLLLSASGLMIQTVSKAGAYNYQDNVFYVDNNWENTAKVPDNLSPGKNAFAGIENAVNHADPNENNIIKVFGGIYDNTIENFPIKVDIDNLKIKGVEEPDNILVKGKLNLDIFKIIGENIKISGFTLAEARNESGLKISSGYGNIVIENNIIENNLTGIEIGSSDKSVIENNIVRNNSSNGIWLYNSCFNLIENNKLFRNEYRGIYLDGVNENNTIENNLVKWTGILSNYAGIVIRNSSNNVIRSNIVEDGSNHGIWCKDDSENNTIVGNRVENNKGTGIRIINSRFNLSYRNFIFNNSLNAYDNSTNSWDNESEGNWWGNWQPKDESKDSNSDGILEDPYEILGDSNQDDYPQTLITLKFPENDTILKENTLTIQWASPILYWNRLQLDNNPSLDSPSENLLTQTYLNVKNLEDGIYYWRGKGKTKENNYILPWSRTHRFIIDNSSPENLHLLEPENNEVVTDNVFFSWTEVSESNFDNYELWVGDNLKYWTKSKSDNSISLYLENGVYEWRVVAHDNVGHENVSENRTLSVDNLAPRGSYLLGPGNDSWSDESISFSWNKVKEANFKRYELWLDGSLVHSTTNKSNTSKIIYKDDGTYRWEVRAYDQVGQENISENWIVHVDNTPPENLRLLKPENGEVVTSNASFSWTEVFENNFENYELWIDEVGDGGDVWLVDNTQSISDNSLQVFLDNGRYDWWVEAHDNLGHETVSDSRRVRVDSFAPRGLELRSPENDSFEDESVFFSWAEVSESNFENYELWIDEVGDGDDAWLVDNTQSISDNSLQVFLDNGRYEWWVIAHDNVGHDNISETWVLKVDNNNPQAFRLTFPENNSIISDSTPALGWKDSGDEESSIDYYEIYFDGVMRGNSSDNNFEITNVLSEGLHLWRVLAVDKVGNKRWSENFFNFTVDNTPPENLELLSPGEDEVVSDNVFFSWTEVSESNFENYELWIDEVGDGDDAWLVDNTQSISDNSLQVFLDNGRYEWWVEAHDNVGHEAVSESRILNVDNIAPRSLELRLSDNVWSDESVQFSWTEVSEVHFDNYELWIDGTMYEKVTRKSTSTSTEMLDTGEYEWWIVAHDGKGHENRSENRIIKVDNEKPQSFTLSIPRDNSLISDVEPTLGWERSQDNHIGLDYYEVWIDENFENYVYLDNQYEVRKNLDESSHNWKIFAVDEVGNRRKSENIFNFTVDNTPPRNLSLLEPKNGDIVSTTVFFSWTEVSESNFENYELWIDEVGDGGDAWLEENTSDIGNNSNIRVSLENDRYKWWVVAHDNVGHKNVSEDRIVRVDSFAPRGLELRSPENDSFEDESVFFSWAEVSESNFENYELWIDEVGDGDDAWLVDNTQSISDNSLQVFLDNGRYEWWVIAHDNVGHDNISEDRIVKVDNIAPRGLELKSPEDSSFENETVSFSWREVRDENFENYEFWIEDLDEQTARLENSIDNRLENSFSLSLENGRYEWWVIAHDSLGNENMSESWTMKVDDKKPNSFTLAKPGEEETVTYSTPIFKWEESQDEESGIKYYEVYIDDVLENQCSGNVFEIKHELSEGIHDWRVRAVDNVGNKRWSENHFYFTIDNKKPTRFNLLSPDNNSLITDTTPLLKWKSSDDETSGIDHYEIWVNYETWVKRRNIENVSSAKVEIRLSNDGNYDWRILAVDEAGNKRWSENHFFFALDNNSPKNLRLLDPEDDSIVTDNVFFSWTEVSESNFENYELWIDNLADDENAWLDDNTRSISDNSLQVFLDNGRYEWWIEAHDNLGHENMSKKRIVKVDNIAPRNITLRSPKNDRWNGENVKLEWSEVIEANFENYEIWIEDFNDAEGVKLFKSISRKEENSANILLDNGRYKWYIKAYDNIGRENLSGSENFRIDNIKPARFNLFSPYNEVSSKDNYLLRWENSEDNESGLDNYVVWLNGRKFAETDNSKYYTGHLSDNSYTWYVEAVDNRNNFRESENHFSFTVDTEVPQVEVVNPNGGENLAGGENFEISWVTNDNNPDTVTIQYSSNSGDWDNLVEGMPDEGSYVLSVPSDDTSRALIRVIVRDVVGHVASDNSDSVFTVDSSKPSEFNLSSPENELSVSSAKPELQWGTASDSVTTIENYEVYLDNSLVEKTSDNFYKVQRELSEGVHDWRIRAVDSVGNKRWSEEHFYFNVDNIAPRGLSLNFPKDDEWTGRFATFSWTEVEENSFENYEVWIDGGLRDFIVEKSVNSITLEMSGGSHEWYVVANSKLQENRSESAVFKTDNLKPSEFELLSPENNLVTENSSLDIRWESSSDENTGLDNYEILMDGDLVDTVGDNDYTLSPPEGKHGWRVKAVDEVGNKRTSENHFNFTVDNKPPLGLNLNNPEDNGWSNSSALLSWSEVTEPSFENYEVWMDNLANDEQAQRIFTTENKKENFVSLNLKDGHFKWFVKAYSVLGHEDRSENWTFRIDNSSPESFSLVSPENGEWVAELGVTLSWLESQDFGSGLSRYEVWVESERVATVDNVEVSEVVFSAVGDGRFEWKVIAFDKAGNARVSDVRWSFIVDNTKPSGVTLVAPENGEWFGNTSIQFDWEKVEENNFENYEVYIDGNVVKTIENKSITETSAEVPTNSIHTCRIVTNDVVGHQASSDTRTIYIDTSPPSSFDLRSPKDDLSTRENRQVLKWENSSDDDSGIEYYNLYIDGEKVATISDNSYFYEFPPSSHTWYVEAVDAVGNQKTSSKRTIKISTTPWYASTMFLLLVAAAGLAAVLGGLFFLGKLPSLSSGSSSGEGAGGVSQVSGGNSSIKVAEKRMNFVKKFLDSDMDNGRVSGGKPAPEIKNSLERAIERLGIQEKVSVNLKEGEVYLEKR